QPQYPLRKPSRVLAATASAKSPVSAPRSTSSISPPNASAISSPVTALQMGQARSLNAISASGPSSEAPNSSMFSGPMPSNQSMPSAGYGATPPMVAAPRTRSGSPAATAMACGPPPDQPRV